MKQHLDDEPDAPQTKSSSPALPAWMNFLGARDARGGTTLLLVHANIVAYAFAYWLTQPMLPFLTKQLARAT
jgi:hypothetical protein